MKRLFIKGIQIICILPATVSVPFALWATLAGVLGLLDGTYGFSEKALAVAIGVSTLSGVAASWAVISSERNYFRTNPSFKRKVQIGLALGAFGGCFMLIWAGKFVIALNTSVHDKRAAILSWVAFCFPSIGLVTSQFVALAMMGTAIKKPDETPPANSEAITP
jgi:hypothetical protein